MRRGVAGRTEPVTGQQLETVAAAQHWQTVRTRESSRPWVRARHTKEDTPAGRVRNSPQEYTCTIQKDGSQQGDRAAHRASQAESRSVQATGRSGAQRARERGAQRGGQQGSRVARVRAGPASQTTQQLDTHSTG